MPTQMKFMLRTGLILTFAAAACFAQPQQQTQPKQQQRDLKIEKIEDAGAPPKQQIIPRSYAVIVGISRYQNCEERLQLQFAERDAQSIYTIAISPEGGNFKQENVHVLEGAKATLANVRHEIGEWLPSVAKEGDRVLIYFAGHGFIYQGKGYLAPFDFDLNNVAATGYPMDELSVAIGSKIHATSKILLTDACHSGAISPEDVESLNAKLEKLNPSLFSLTASRASERSFESPDLEGGHGVFTYYVVRGMGGAADVSPRDGIVTADELSEYVHTQVREATQGPAEPNLRPQQLRSKHAAFLHTFERAAGNAAGAEDRRPGVRIQHGRGRSICGWQIHRYSLQGKVAQRAWIAAWRAHCEGRPHGVRAGWAAPGNGVSRPGFDGFVQDSDSAAA